MNNPCNSLNISKNSLWSQAGESLLCGWLAECLSGWKLILARPAVLVDLSILWSHNYYRVTCENDWFGKVVIHFYSPSHWYFHKSMPKRQRNSRNLPLLWWRDSGSSVVTSPYNYSDCPCYPVKHKDRFPAELPHGYPLPVRGSMANSTFNVPCLLNVHLSSYMSVSYP